MDIDDGIGLGQLAAQPLVLPGEFGEGPDFGDGGVGFAPTLLWFKPGAFSGLAPSSGFGPMGDDVVRRDALQGRHVAAMVPLPDLGLPKRVEPFDGALEPGLAWGRECRNHPQGQTQPADAPDRVGELVRTLEDRIVVELRVAGQPVLTPVPKECVNGGLGAGLRHDPGRRERGMQADTSEHRNQRATGDLQVFDEVKAVEISFGSDQIG